MTATTTTQCSPTSKTTKEAQTGGSVTPYTGRDALLQSIRDTFDRCIGIVERKNQDYGADADPFRNFRGAELLGLSVEHGILLRLLDKVARISNLLSHSPRVTDETMCDTIEDAIGYLAILKAYRETK